MKTIYQQNSLSEYIELYNILYKIYHEKFLQKAPKHNPYSVVEVTAGVSFTSDFPPLDEPLLPPLPR